MNGGYSKSPAKQAAARQNAMKAAVTNRNTAPILVYGVTPSGRLECIETDPTPDFEGCLKPRRNSSALNHTMILIRARAHYTPQDATRHYLDRCVSRLEKARKECADLESKAQQALDLHNRTMKGKP